MLFDPSIVQPRSQGFSLLNWVGGSIQNGKALGTRLSIVPVMQSTVSQNEHRGRDFLVGSGGMLPQKILKSRGSELAFSTFSMRYFFKKINLHKV